MVNPSEANDARFWARWRRSGAVPLGRVPRSIGIQEMAETGRTPFIRGYGEIANPDASIFRKIDPLPPTHVYGPGEVMGDDRAWGLVPYAGLELFRVGLVANSRSSIYAVRGKDVFRIYQRSSRLDANVIERIRSSDVPEFEHELGLLEAGDMGAYRTFRREGLNRFLATYEK